MGAYLFFTRQSKARVSAAPRLAAFTHAPFSGGKGGGGGCMRFAGLFKQACGFGTAQGCRFRRGGKRLTLGLRFRVAAAQISHAGRSIFGARGPKACFIGKAAAARGD